MRDRSQALVLSTRIIYFSRKGEIKLDQYIRRTFKVVRSPKKTNIEIKIDSVNF